MRKESKIKNLDDLRLEISRLKILAREQEKYLNDQYLLFNEKIEAPIRFFKSAVSWVPGVDFAKHVFTKGSANEDWVSKVFRIGLPVILNRFFLRKAGFIKRALVTLLSQQVATVLNKGTVSELLEKVTTFIQPAKRRRRKAKYVDYGIPPDSETY